MSRFFHRRALGSLWELHMFGKGGSGCEYWVLVEIGGLGTWDGCAARRIMISRVS